MAIHLITGTPGSGKSYLAVSILLESYFYKEHDAWYPKKITQPDGTEKEILLITNIEGLTLEHESLDEIFNKVPFDKFFTADYQEKISQKYQDKKIVYVIDEAQRFIGPRFRDEKVIYYFDWHRHLDHDIYLITQDFRKLSKDIALLHEFEFRAVKASFQAFGFFQYILKSNGEISGRKTVRKKKEVFQLYKSFQAPGATHNIKKNRILIYSLIGFISMFFLWKMTFASLTGPKNSENKTVSSAAGQLPPGQLPPGQLPPGQLSPGQLSPGQQSKPLLVPLRDVAAKFVNGRPVKIYYFRCPVTSEMIKPIHAHYRIIIIENVYYAQLKPEDYDYESAAYSKPKDTTDYRTTSPRSLPSSGGERVTTSENDRLRATY